MRVVRLLGRRVRGLGTCREAARVVEVRVVDGARDHCALHDQVRTVVLRANCVNNYLVHTAASTASQVAEGLTLSVLGGATEVPHVTMRGGLRRPRGAIAFSRLLLDKCLPEADVM